MIDSCSKQKIQLRISPIVLVVLQLLWFRSAVDATTSRPSVMQP